MKAGCRWNCSNWRTSWWAFSSTGRVSTRCSITKPASVNSRHQASSGCRHRAARSRGPRGPRLGRARWWCARPARPRLASRRAGTWTRCRLAWGKRPARGGVASRSSGRRPVRGRRSAAARRAPLVEVVHRDERRRHVGGQGRRQRGLPGRRVPVQGWQNGSSLRRPHECGDRLQDLVLAHRRRLGVWMRAPPARQPPGEAIEDVYASTTSRSRVLTRSPSLGNE